MVLFLVEPGWRGVDNREGPGTSPDRGLEHSRRCAPVNGHAGREGEETGCCDVCQLRVNTDSH